MTRVDRRGLVRAELGRVALALFAERGFDAVTVEEIAAEAGMSARTFFRYFATKDEVVLDRQRRVHERLVDALLARPAKEGPVRALRNAYLTTSQVAPEDRARIVQLGRILASAPALQIQAHGEHRDQVEPLVEEVARRMGVDPSEDRRARVVVLAMSVVADAEWRAWLDDGGHGDPSTRIADALQLVEDGLTSLDKRHRRKTA